MVSAIKRTKSKISHLQHQPSEQQSSLMFDNFSAEEHQQLQHCIKQLQAFSPAPDFQPYFEAVLNNPIYKPGNPTLALRHVAKTYRLDFAQFQRAFTGS